MKFTLGNVDADATPASKSDFLSRFHNTFSDGLKRKQQFRDESNSAWADFKALPGAGVRELQQFLHDAGFLIRPDTVDGIYGYTTQAAVRLFQEYIRTVKGDASIGVPDGVAGPNTLGQVEKWKQDKVGLCEWARVSPQNPSPEFTQWMQLLAKAKEHFLANPSPIQQRVEPIPNLPIPEKSRIGMSRPKRSTSSGCVAGRMFSTAAATMTTFLSCSSGAWYSNSGVLPIRTPKWPTEKIFLFWWKASTTTSSVGTR
ncbi:MAG: peptidoglycan-binding protein [Lewinellaceae bacterium]|nr:peptidoglycan-binding protein [Lewinellaceae bacterium]